MSLITKLLFWRMNLTTQVSSLCVFFPPSPDRFFSSLSNCQLCLSCPFFCCCFFSIGLRASTGRRDNKIMGFAQGWISPSLRNHMHRSQRPRQRSGKTCKCVSSSHEPRAKERTITFWCQGLKCGIAPRIHEHSVLLCQFLRRRCV